MQKLKLSIIISVYLLSVFLSTDFTAAQTPQPLTQTYLSSDGTFWFFYPESWSLQADEKSNVLLSNHSPEETFTSESGWVTIVISSPVKLDLYRVQGYPTTPIDILRMGLGVGSVVESLFTQKPATAEELQNLTLPDESDYQITEFEVLGRPAAWGKPPAVSMRQTVNMQSMTVVIDVDSDAVVLLSAVAFNEEMTTYEAAILAIAQSVRYNPVPPAYSGNPRLPQVFTGQTSTLSRGMVTLFYPSDWVAYNQLQVMIQNRAEPISLLEPKTGQLIAYINPPDYTAQLFPPIQTLQTPYSPLMVLQKYLESSEEAFSKAEITFTAAVEATTNGKAASYYRTIEKTKEKLDILVDVGNGQIMELVAITPPGEMEQYLETLLGIAGTLEYASTEST